MTEISVIIPTFNRSKILNKCLDFIELQDFDRLKFEIIIVDDGGSDDTAELVNLRKNLPIKYLKLPKNSGPSAARNFGIKNSRGGILAFIDDDCFAESHWLSEIHRIHAKYQDILALQGGVDIAENSSLIYLAQKYNIDRINKLRIGALVKEDIYEAYFVGTGNLSVKRRCLEDIGLFDEGLRAQEDRDIYYRLIAKNITVYYSPEVKVKHFGRRTICGLCRQYYEYGKNVVIFQRKWDSLKNSGPYTVYSWDTYKEYLKNKGINFESSDKSERLILLISRFGLKGFAVFTVLSLMKFFHRLGRKIEKINLGIH